MLVRAVGQRRWVMPRIADGLMGWFVAQGVVGERVGALSRDRGDVMSLRQVSARQNFADGMD